MKLPVGKIIMWLILLLLALGVAGIGVGYAEATAGRDALTTAARAIQAKDFAAANASLDQAKTHMGRARIAFGGAQWMRPIPWIGTVVSSAYDVAYAASETAAALKDTVTLAGSLQKEFEQIRALQPRGRTSLATLSSEDRAKIGIALVRASVKVRSGEARIALARARLTRINPQTGITGLDDARSVLITTLGQLEDRLRPLSVATLILPRLAGFPEPTNTLFLFLNNHELRPGGGFIGTYALATAYAGTVQKLEVGDSYKLDKAAEHTGIVPPEPIAKYLGVKEWFFRDSNWSPDFPTSAAKSLELFRLEHQKAYGSDPAISFVVGLTPNVTSELLKLTGPIRVDTSTFTSENIADELEFQVERGFTAKGVLFAQRKEILARLSEIMLTRLSALPLDEWPKIVQILQTQIREKQLMAYSPDPEMQSMLDLVGASARIPQTDGDFLMVVDANLGSLKTDPVVHRAIRYEINLTPDGEFLAKVTIQYTHTGKPSWKIARYRSWTRIFGPGGEMGSIPVDVSPGKTATYSVTYQIPKQVVDGSSYHLLAARALGSGVADLTLHLDFGKNVVSALPSEEVGSFDDTRYDHQGKLREDQDFLIRFK